MKIIYGEEMQLKADELFIKDRAANFRHMVYHARMGFFSNSAVWGKLGSIWTNAKGSVKH